MPTAAGEFELASWNEETYAELETGGKLTRADDTQKFTGAASGDGSVQWLMCYQPDGTARFVGMQRVECTLDGKAGSFVAETTGDFDGGRAEGSWSIVAGSGTGELAGISGHGKFSAPHGPKAAYDLTYSIG
jgi:hypothetical protein